MNGFNKMNLSYRVEDGGFILNINKPSGMSSFDVVREVRRLTSLRKVGHAGTLDPLAEGVLLICAGRATKRVSELMELEKEYRGTVRLGITTETDDGEGKIIKKKSVPDFSEEEIESVLNLFVGEIMQVPPMYSAIKSNGERLYRLARKGITVEREARVVHIKKIRLLSWKNPDIHLQVSCSRGTYIRALARDIGERLNTGGYLKYICRTRIGNFRVEDGYKIDEIEELFKQHECI